MKWTTGLLVLAASASAESNKPIQKVVALLKEMRSTMEKDQKADEEFHAKMTCWCDDNEKKKGDAVKAAEAQIANLDNEIKLQTALAGKAAATIEVTTKEIADLVQNIQQQMEKLNEEYEEFKESSKDQRELIATLKRALEALGGKKSGGDEAANFLQFKQVVSGSRFGDVMKKDLFAVLGALNESDDGAKSNASVGDLFDEMFSGKRALTTLTQQEPPKDGTVMAANSYNSRSGQIVGIISEMHDNGKLELQQMMGAFKQSGVAAVQLAGGRMELANVGLGAEFCSEMGLDFEALEDGSMVKTRKTKEAKLKQAKQDKAAAEQAVTNAERSKKKTKDALGADQAALIEITEKCKEGGEEYNIRVQERLGEIKAVGEALGVLTDDASRDLFASSMPAGPTASFLQITAKAETALRNRVAATIMKTARRVSSLHLASLAVRAQLDSFGKVKEMMDKMLVELKKQQTEETDQRESCRSELNENESQTTDASNEKEDLENEIADMKMQIEKLTEAKKVAEEQRKQTLIAVKQAGTVRADESKSFQQTVTDQRMTVNVLNRALGKLDAFYNKDKSFAQQPGNATKDMPKAKEYNQQGAAPGVMGLIQQIIADATQLEKEAMHDENDSQQEYSKFVTAGANTVAANDAQIADSGKQIGTLEKQKSQRKQDLLNQVDEVEGLQDMNKNLHLKCDFLLKNFDLRQEARQEEMDSIASAKAVLSGADFA